MIKYEQLLEYGSDPANYDASENYSSTAARFYAAAATNDNANRVLEIRELICTVEDADSDYNKYGDLTALTNGVVFRINTLTDGTWGSTPTNLFREPVKQLTDWMKLGFAITPLNDSAGATRCLQAVKTFPDPIVIVGSQYQVFEVYLNDNLSGLAGHHFQIGYTERSKY